MTDLKREDPAVEVKVETKVEDTKTKEPDKWEKKAVEQGWKPKDQWDGDESEWREAREYVERGELFEKIDTQTRELKQLRKVLDTLKDHHLRVKQDSFEEAVKSLKQEREAAKQQEDIGKVLDLTEKIDDLKEKQTREVNRAAQELREPVPAGPTPVFQEWHRTNQWYKPNGKDAMSSFANIEADRYLFEHKTATQEQMLRHVTERIKEEFPAKFEKIQEKARVEGTGGSRPVNNKSTPVLSEQQEKIMNTLVKSGVITKEQYLKDIQKYEESHGG